VSFSVSADAYDRFMGRYSVQLGPQLTAFARVADGQRALDVGCGPGALTAQLVALLGADAVAAVDPSEPFTAAVRERLPGVRVETAPAEHLPFADGAFDATLAQLVVPFMRDAATGLAEMRRVTREGGVVAACAWDHAGGRSPLTTFWRAANELEPGARNENAMAGVRAGHLAELLEATGLDDVEATELTARLEHTSFEGWWAPFDLGVGPVGAYLAKLDAERVAAIRSRCRELLGDGPFEVTAIAWAARGRA
jgi:SAM-dependent methyltransferase